MARAKLSIKDMGRIAGRIADKAMPDIDFSLRVNRGDFRKRWRNVQAKMKEQGYDLLYVCGSELDRTDVAWLTGFYDPIAERYGALVPVVGKPLLLAGCEGHHVVQEAADASGCDTALLREFQISDEEYRHVKWISMKQAASKLKIGRKPKVMIASPGEILPQAQYQLLVDNFGKQNVVFDPLLLQLIKYVKSLKELRIMEQANKVTDAAFRAMLAVTVPGVLESQVAGIGDFVMKALGAHRTGFPTIVTSGARGYTVIGPASDKVIKHGEVVSMGLSPTWHGYHGIVRRTVRVGRDFTPRQLEFLEAVEGLYRTVFEATVKAARGNLDAITTDAAGKAYLASLKVRNLKGALQGLKEPYSYLHNGGCSECHEGYGAVTGDFVGKFGKGVSLMLDTALIGFEHDGVPLFPLIYAVVEDSLWKNGRNVGIYNRIPIRAQSLLGNEKPITRRNQNPYYRPVS